MALLIKNKNKTTKLLKKITRKSKRNGMSNETRPIGKVYPNTENYTHIKYNYKPVEEWDGIIELEGSVIVDRDELYLLLKELCTQQADDWGVGYKTIGMNSDILLRMVPWDTIPINKIERAARYFTCKLYNDMYNK